MRDAQNFPHDPPKLPLREETQYHAGPTEDDIIPHKYDPAPIPIPVCYCGEKKEHPVHIVCTCHRRGDGYDGLERDCPIHKVPIADLMNIIRAIGNIEL